MTIDEFYASKYTRFHIINIFEFHHQMVTESKSLISKKLAKINSFEKYICSSSSSINAVGNLGLQVVAHVDAPL
ncbi:hypothetical protein BpHYR1_010524 [Brachionus plicatilis]|uniref:Uncharacterized protein n=1 Tax=Brachionus plicatilis TaxID=10195 RepID=A0A3M7PQE2_BRAPC|nr:hypothetical protein BpHYR1_010524 [Brachionus plicatilis]